MNLSVLILDESVAKAPFNMKMWLAQIFLGGGHFILSQPRKATSHLASHKTPFGGLAKNMLLLMWN